MPEQLTRSQKDRVFDLVIDERLPVEEARGVVIREAAAEKLIPPRARVGEESENLVMDYLLTVRNALKVRRTERGGDEDVDRGWDIVVGPRLKLPLLDEFYIQVKSSQAGALAFRKEMEKRVWSRNPIFWKKQSEDLSPGKLARALEKAVDEEILRRKFILVVAGDRNQIDSDYRRGEAALYKYWQERWQKRTKRNN